MQGYQWLAVKRIKSYFREQKDLRKKMRHLFLVLISSIKPISSTIPKDEICHSKKKRALMNFSQNLISAAYTRPHCNKIFVL